MKNPIMQGEEESVTTVSTLPREDKSWRQGIVDHYTNDMINIALKDPYVTLTQLVGRVLRRGPLRTKKQLAHVCGGGGQFRRTYEKLEWIRRAAAADGLDKLPMDWLGDSVPAYWCRETGAPDRYEAYIRWWAPNVLDTEPFDEDHRLPKLQDRVCRYPSQGDADAFAESQDESGGEEGTSRRGEADDGDIAPQEE